jgi:ATP-binding cassette subfamily F protein 3
MSVLNVYRLTKAYNIYPVFKDVTFQINKGEKVALVGVNGAGKSTLLKIVAGEERAESGEIAMTRGLRVAYVPQEATFAGDRTLHAEMLSVFDELEAMQAEIAHLQAEMGKQITHATSLWDDMMARYDGLTHRFELMGGYDYEVRVRQILTGLNFSPDFWERKVSQFSGGQKTRAALAKALLANPDLLLLDEPTNHLDLETLEWLETFLKNWENTIVVISHDRYFLDKVVSRVLDLSFGRIEDYPGNYTKYTELRTERLERALAEYQAQQEYIAKTEEFIRRYKNGQRYRQARGRQKQLDRLERINRPRERDKLHLSLQTDLRSGKLVLATEELIVGYHSRNGAQALFRVPDLEIQRGERVAIVGANGSGKSTFLKTIMEHQTPLEGLVEFGTNVQVGYYAQSHEGLNFKNTILEEILLAHPMSEGEARNYLGRFLFSGDEVFKKLDALSGGERSRVALAKLMLAKANFLILDEPTNHLDTNAREALEELLGEYNGTILFVSHDRYFIDALATQVWAIKENKLTSYLGNYSDYQNWLELAKPAVEEPKAKPTAKPAQHPKNGTNGKDNQKEEKQRQKRISELEKTIANLELRLNQISEEMTTATIKQDVAAITRLGQEYEQKSAELEKLFEEWGALA